MTKATHSLGWRVGVVGLGYVGLPLAVLFARKGHEVVGIDTDPSRVEMVNAGTSYVQDVPSTTLKGLVKRGRLRARADFADVALLDAVLICVPTPLDERRLPDISSVIGAVAEVAPRLRHGALVVLESSVYPGATEELVQPMLEATGDKVGKDFYLAYSPERVNPGSPPPLAQIDKLIAGVTLACQDRACELYGTAFRNLVRVSSPRVAEMAKLVENAHRLINISFVNELAVVARRLGVDIWEVLEAAATKPFGYAPYQPGPGVGGHCIPVDPLYLQWSAARAGTESVMIRAAQQVNDLMPAYVVSRLRTLLGCLTGKRVLLLGAAYKKNTADTRESPALELFTRLEAAGAVVSYHDPQVPRLEVGGVARESRPLTQESLRAVDAVVVVTDHAAVDYQLVARSAPLVLDTRNALRAFHNLPTVHRL